MFNTFQPKDFIVTKDGQRGFIVHELPNSKGFYKIHLTDGYQVYSEKDLELDPYMMED